MEETFQNYHDWRSGCAGKEEMIEKRRSRQNGYERTYELVKEKLRNCDLEKAAAEMGLCRPEAGKLRITFLGHRYCVNNEEVVCMDDDTEPHPIEKSLLIYYLTSGGRGDPTGEYIFPAQMTGQFGSSAKGNGLSWQLSPLEKFFADKTPEEFSRVMEALGTERIPSGKDGLAIWQYCVLPGISTQILYYEADEEFPCVIQIKFDSGIRRYFEFEPAAFLHGCMAKWIRDGAERIL